MLLYFILYFCEMVTRKNEEKETKKKSQGDRASAMCRVRRCKRTNHPGKNATKWRNIYRLGYKVIFDALIREIIGFVFLSLSLHHARGAVSAVTLVAVEDVRLTDTSCEKL